MSDSPSISYWRPGNALAALGIGIMRVSTWFPLSWMRAVGKAIGTVAAIVFPFRRHVGMVNLRLCFPDMSEKERKKLLYRHYQSMGMGVFELAASWWAPEASIMKISSVKGLEHLDEVAKSGRGALLLTAHFTTLEMGGRVLLAQRDFSCLYRKPNQPVIAQLMTRERNARMKKVIHFDQMNELIRALREGEFVWYAPDQGKRLKYSALLPFFGEPAVTNTATGRIARMGRAAIIPYTAYRKPDGTYQVEIYPELKDIPSKDPEADGLAINHIIEDFIMKAPEQYFWLHRRFKRRPGMPDAYAKD